MSTSRSKDRRHNTPLEESTALSRSCDSLGNYEQLRDDYITEMHLTVIKDILRCWRNMLRKPTISLAGACWEDFEIVESSSPVKVSEDQGSVSLPVRLRKESTNLDSNNCCGKYIAKVRYTCIIFFADSSLASIMVTELDVGILVVGSLLTEQ